MSSKYEMQLSSRKRNFNLDTGRNGDVEILPPLPSSKSEKITEQHITQMLNSGEKVGMTALQIAQVIANGECEIRRIQANSEAEVRRIESEIKKLVATTQAEVIKMQEENKIWHSRFDKKVEAMQLILERINGPEFRGYNEEARMMIIKYYFEQLKVD